MTPSRSLASLALTMLLAGCAPALAGPELPRPVGPPPVVTTTTVPVTTTTIDPAELMASRCPTEFCLVYQIRDGATWSNGTALAAEDFSRTVDLLDDPLTVAPTRGYDLIESVEVIDEDRFRVVFSEPFGAWQQLFSRVIPAGLDPTDITGLPTSGAFRFVEWVPGDRIVLRRDPEWWSPVDLVSGSTTGTVDQVTFVFYPDPAEMLDALEDGVVDVITTRPDLETMERLGGMDDVSSVVAPGPLWEHIDFNHQDPTLSLDWVRGAISLAIDREKILDRTIRLFDAEAAGLGNTIWMANTTNYEDHYQRDFDPVAAGEMLVANGCERGDDGVFVCRGRRMSFIWASTDDDPARIETFESVREDLAQIGVEVVPAFRSPSDFVTREFLFGGPEAWQMINFSWHLGSDPAPQNQSYHCGDIDLNVNRYCSPEVEELVRATETITDPAERAAVYNEADRLYLDRDAVIPLYQKPILMAWGPAVSGLAPNWSYSTDMWNAAAWTGEESIVVALPAEPETLDPLSTRDESANMILSMLFYGALGMTPGHTYVPVLVSSVEVVEGPN
ncbi:MAG TPA: ABC transporter substrate-binding protein [Acidimicrobiia bacterium]|nr:ABC transporter substrate-binding protein [Acidimicrobiia bacterium]